MPFGTETRLFLQPAFVSLPSTTVGKPERGVYLPYTDLGGETSILGLRGHVPALAALCKVARHRKIESIQNMTVQEKRRHAAALHIPSLAMRD